MSSTFDCVWYWSGGRESGEWRRAMPLVQGKDLKASLDAVANEIRLAGRVAVLGSTRIGRPEGPPVEKLEALEREIRWPEKF